MAQSPPPLNAELCRERQSRLRNYLSENNLDAAVFFNRHYVYCLSGYWHEQPLTPTAILVAKDGDTTIFTHDEAPVAPAADQNVPYVPNHLFTLKPNLSGCITELLNPFLTSFQRIATEEQTPSAQLIGPECVDVSEEYQYIRRKKDADEVSAFEFTIQCADEAYATAQRVIEPGVTEVAVMTAMQESASLAAGEFLSGWGQDFKCGSPGGFARQGRKIEDGELFVLDESDFWHLLQTSHAFARNILRGLTGRLRNNNRTVSSESRRREELQRAVVVDRLTGVFNRHWLEEELPAACNRTIGENGALSIAVVDIDHFKRFNDDHGHQAGDRVLEAVAQTLRESLRQGDVVARYGGEEFVVLFPGAALQPAARVAERLRRAVQRLRLSGLPPVRVSIGVAELAPDEGPSTLVARADTALYEAKTGGRNRVVCAEPALCAA